MAKKKILVTGGTGFIGAYLLRYLVASGVQNIRVLKRKNSPMDLVASIKEKVEWVEGDLLDTTSLEDAMKGVVKVYHCAALISFNDKDRKKMLRVNQKGTENIVNIALAMEVEKFLFVSSIAALGRNKNESIINEQTKWKEGSWNSPYGRSKYLAEMEVWRGMAEGLNAVIVNPSNVMGSGYWKDRTSSGQFFYKIWKGLPFYPAGSSGFVDVRDVVKTVVELMERDVSGERYIINGENISFKKLFDKIAEALNTKSPAIKVNSFLRESAWRITWLFSKTTGKPPFITKHTARSSSRDFFYENDKLNSLLSFEYTPIDQTIEETGKQFLSSIKNGYRPCLLPFK